MDAPHLDTPLAPPAERSMWDAFVDNGFLGKRTRMVNRYVILAWPSQLWHLATCCMSLVLLFQPEAFPSIYPSIYVCRVFLCALAFVSLCAAGVVSASLRFLHSNTFKESLEQNYPKSNLQQTEWRPLLSVGPPSVVCVGHVFDTGIGMLLFVVKLLAWSVCLAACLGIFSEPFHLCMYLYWILLTLSRVCFDESCSFAMVLCEFLSMDAVWSVLETVRVWETVVDGSCPDEYRNRFWLMVVDKHKEMDVQLRQLWKAARVVYGIFIVVLGVLILLMVLVSLCLVKLFLSEQGVPKKLLGSPVVPAAAAIGVLSIWTFFYKLMNVASITDKCMSKSALRNSIYSAAVQACGRSMGNSTPTDMADYWDCLNYLDRNPTGVIIGILIDTRLVFRIIISLGTVFLAIWSYMVAMVGLKS